MSRSFCTKHQLESERAGKVLEVLTRHIRSSSVRVFLFCLRNDVRVPLGIHGETKATEGPKSEVVPMNFKI
jgi:hypothetical protein